MDCERFVGRIYSIQYPQMALVEIEWTWLFLGNDYRNCCVHDSSGSFPFNSGNHGIPLHTCDFLDRVHYWELIDKTRARHSIDEILYAGTALGILETDSCKNSKILS